MDNVVASQNVTIEKLVKRIAVCEHDQGATEEVAALQAEIAKL